jgi:hypothetical protein
LKKTEAKQCTIPIVTNRYFHELEQKEVDTLIANKKNVTKDKIDNKKDECNG